MLSRSEAAISAVSSVQTRKLCCEGSGDAVLMARSPAIARDDAGADSSDVVPRIEPMPSTAQERPPYRGRKPWGAATGVSH